MAATGTHDIDTNGEVLLICGGERGGGHIKKLRVSSHTLSLGSKVFRSMLGPHFKEGRTLKAGETLELPLPEDDPDAMTFMCLAMHLRYDRIPEVPELETLMSLATLCDKYDCAVALKLLAESWFTKRLEMAKDASERGKLFSTAFLFGNTSMLHSVSIHLVLKDSGVCLGNDEMELRAASLPSKDDVVLRNVITKSRIRLTKFITDQMDAYFRRNGGCCTVTCIAGAISARSLATQLRTAKLWPLNKLWDRSLEAVLDAISRISFVNPHRQYCDPSSCNQLQAPTADTMTARFVTEGRSIRSEIEGLKMNMDEA